MLYRRTHVCVNSSGTSVLPTGAFTTKPSAAS